MRKCFLQAQWSRDVIFDTKNTKQTPKIFWFTAWKCQWKSAHAKHWDFEAVFLFFIKIVSTWNGVFSKYPSPEPSLANQTTYQWTWQSQTAIHKHGVMVWPFYHSKLCWLNIQDRYTTSTSSAAPGDVDLQTVDAWLHFLFRRGALLTEKLAVATPVILPARRRSWMFPPLFRHTPTTSTSMRRHCCCFWAWAFIQSASVTSQLMPQSSVTFVELFLRVCRCA